jgi:DNA modification methylase
MPDAETNDSTTYRFACQSPLFMCPQCSRAETCRDLMMILRTFALRESAEDRPEFDYRANFPFLRAFDPDGTVDRHNKLNELTSGEWLTFTRTVFSESFPKVFGHELRRQHPDYKAPHLMGQLIAFFTRPGDMVLDPFAGTGTTLVAASLLEREAVGFEINPDWIEVYYNICAREDIPKQKLVQGDCGHLIKFVPPASVDFIVIDPPDPTRVQEWAGPVALSKPALEAFFEFLHNLLEHCHKALRVKKHLVVFTHNLYQGGAYYHLTPHFANAAESVGFVLKGEKIWENKAEKLRPYGYPHTYVPNIVHYNILVFRREG